MSSFETIDNPSSNPIRHDLTPVSTFSQPNKGLQFDDSQFRFRSHKILGDYQVPAMIRLAIKLKIAKNESQAIVVLFVSALLLIGISVFIFRRQGVKPPSLDPSLSQFQTR